MDKDLATNFVVAQFIGLELQLSECLNFVPYVAENRHLVSPKFVPILMESCSLIDSVLRYHSGVGRNGNLKAFREICEPHLELEAKVTMFLNAPISLLRPFRNWHVGVPSWWTAYNEIKHDRINRMESATFENTVLALAGLHQIIASYGIFIGALLRSDWINTEDDAVTQSMAGIAQVFTNPRLPSMAVESRLFVSPSQENFVKEPADPESRYLELDYAVANLSERVKNFVWAQEDF